MTANPNEKYYFTNQFGEVSDRRLIYFWRKGWFSGKRRIDIPMKQVVSVSHDIERKIFAGLFYIVIGLFLLTFIIGIIPLTVGILMLWGSPTVIVRNAGGEAMPSIGFPWEQKAAEEFAIAVRSQLFKD